MRTSLAAALVTLSACKFPPPADVPDDDAVDASLPTDAPTGCTPSTITCDDARGEYVACSATGTIDVFMHCPLGCAPDEEKCLDIDPHNGLAMYLDMVANPPDVTLTGPALVNSVTGVVLDHGVGIVIPTFSRTAPDGTHLTIFVVHDFTLDGALAVPNSAPSDPRPEPAVAIVASGSIRIRGAVDVAAHGTLPGPGGHVPASGDLPPCRGADTFAAPPSASRGGSGAGGATTGGTGGEAASPANPGGPARISLDPLDGGCDGGSVYNSNDGTMVATGGAGGGAIQLAARGMIEISGAGRIDASGAGGRPALRIGGGGGGAGGVVLLEAPQVLLDGPSVVVSTKGGGGAGGSSSSLAAPGSDGGTDAAPARGGTSPVSAAGGDGGSTRPPTGGAFYMASSGGGGGGGGGASGMVAAFTAVGAIAPQNGAAIRGAQMTALLRTRRVP